MSRVYISGPMTGLPEFNYPAFHAAEAEWAAAGWEVLNPARNADGDTTHPWAFYIRLDIPLVLSADAIAMLPGWENSRGANLERTIAEALGLPILDALRATPSEPVEAPEEEGPAT